MKMYAYCADLWCADCAKAIMRHLDESGRLDSGDSNDYPQGPYENEESDIPDHCADCHEFLENPLTDDGYEYVAEHIGIHAYHDCAGDKSVLRQWAEFYRGENVMLDNAIQEWQSLKPEDWL